MLFVLNRNLTVASTTGFAITFKKGEPTFVPPPMHREVRQLGAEAVEGEEGDTDEQQPPVVNAGPSDPEERFKAIKAASEKIVLRNERQDFTSGGSPALKALAKEMGFAIDARERDAAWVRMRQSAS